MNESIFYVSFRWARADQVIALIEKGYWLWRIDITDYYRNVEVDPADWERQAFRFALTAGGAPEELWDTRMAFGTRNSVEIGHRLTCSNLAVLESVGVKNATGTLDDFFGAEESRESCQAAFELAVSSFGMLGWPLQWGPNKTSGPSQVAKWNGFVWDTVKGTVSIPLEKATEMSRLISDALDGGVGHAKKITLTKERFERLRGLLVWAANVVWGGRTYTSGLHNQTLPQRKEHTLRLSPEARADLEWWGPGLAKFNGCAVRLGAWRATVRLCADAMGKGGIGYFFDEDHYAGFAPGDTSEWEGYPTGTEQIDEDVAIMAWETWAIYVAVRSHVGLVRDANIAMWTDNPVTARAVRDLRHRNPAVQAVVARIFWLATEYNFRFVRVEHIPGRMNGMADALSRNDRARFHRLLEEWTRRTATPSGEPRSER